MWCIHLRQVHENRVSGAKKRAKSAASKKQAFKKVGSKHAKAKAKENSKKQVESNEIELCFECDQEDPPERQDDDDDSEVLWICCDGCNEWYHAFCAGIPASEISQMPDWLCLSCCESWDL